MADQRIGWKLLLVSAAKPPYFLKLFLRGLLCPRQKAVMAFVMQKQSLLNNARTIATRIVRRLKRETLGALTILRDRFETRKSVYLERRDPDQRLVQVSLFSASPTSPLVEGLWPSRIRPEGQWLSRGYRHYCWLRESGTGGLDLRLAGKPVMFRRPGIQSFKASKCSPVSAAELAELFQRPKAVFAGIPAETRIQIKVLRAHAQVPVVASRFAGAWVLMDRIERADDNAEHLYRHLRQTDLASKCFYVLDPKSPDWSRLEAEGFQLLAFRSPDHVAAIIHADIVASSQATLVVRWPVPKATIHDLTHFKFAFLQHGVIMNDLSRWLNNLSIDLLATTTKAEFDSICAPESPYALSAKEVVLSGLARHDALLVPSDNKTFLTIAPTWRKGLTGEPDLSSMSRYYRGGFIDSAYAKAWRGLLADPALVAAARKAGLEILFVPHPNLSGYVQEMELPEYVHVYSAARHGTYQDIIRRSALFVTDYSSLSMDMAFLGVPVVYYQFDEDIMFRAHTFRPGYFRYRDDGFGPVTTTHSQTLDKIFEALQGSAPDIYSQRCQQAFPRRDGQNCHRLTELIRALVPQKPH